MIRKAVFPVAGLGTRFLPATKASPKEMLPVVDKPLIQYAVEEAIEAGIEHMIFVTGRSKRAIEDHFDKAFEIEHELSARGKTELLEQLRAITPTGIHFSFVRQSEARGLGHAVLCAAPLVGQEPFAVLLADDLMVGSPNVTAQLVAHYRQHRASVIAVETVSDEQTHSYGIVDPVPNGAGRLRGIVEKPGPAAAPSRLGVAGRYVLNPAVFDLLARERIGAQGEIQLTDALADLLQLEPMYAHSLIGRRFDCGSKLGYLEATVELALAHPELRVGFTRFLQQLPLP